MSARFFKGWNPALDIPSAFGMMPPHLLDSGFVLISIIDSTPRVSGLPSLVPLLHQMGSEYHEIDDDVLVELPTFRALIDERNFFAGFDEVWLFETMPGAGKPDTIRLTSDTKLETSNLPLIERWMQAQSCVAGLGDGDGLNFITSKSELSRIWSGDN